MLIMLDTALHAAGDVIFAGAPTNHCATTLVHSTEPEERLGKLPKRSEVFANLTPHWRGMPSTAMFDGHTSILLIFFIEHVCANNVNSSYQC